MRDSEEARKTDSGAGWMVRKIKTLAIFTLCLSLSCLLDNPMIDGLAAAGLTPDMVAIQGSWVRVDAPYVIELSHSRDGMLQATYFNRRPIHVEKTEMATEKGYLYVMIVLRDTGYNGSTYVLAYDRRADMLYGTYLHGASRQTYEVQFTRKSAR